MGHQEFYGWVLAHYAVHWMMYQAATAHDLQPQRLSFTANVHTRVHGQAPLRTQPQAVQSPHAQAALFALCQPRPVLDAQCAHGLQATPASSVTCYDKEAISATYLTEQY